MQTVPTIVNSHLLSPCRSRFIKISQSDTTRRLNNVISRIEIYNNNKESIISVSNPVIIYDQPNALYSRYLTTLDVPVNSGFILIDIGNDSDICFIVITLNTITNISGSNLDLIDNLGNKKFTINLNPSSTTVYIVTDINIISESGTFFLNKFNYPDCLTNSYCTSVIPNSYYILPKLCFKSIGGAICDNSCMNDIRNYDFDNRITYIENNFESCDLNKETRYIIMFTWDASNDNSMLNARGTPAEAQARIDPLIYIPGYDMSPVEKSGNSFNVTSNVIIVDNSVTNAVYPSMPGVLYNPQTTATVALPATGGTYPNVTVTGLPRLSNTDFVIIFKFKQSSTNIPRMHATFVPSQYVILSYGAPTRGGFRLTPIGLNYAVQNGVAYRTSPVFDTWTTIVLSYNLTALTLSLYLNDEYKGRATNVLLAETNKLVLFNVVALSEQPYYWFNGYIADFKIYQNYTLPSGIYRGTSYTPYLYSDNGDHVVNWKPTNDNPNISLIMQESITRFIKNIFNNKKFVYKGEKNSIINVNNNTVNYLNNIKVVIIFLVYNIPNSSTQRPQNDGVILYTRYVHNNTSTYFSMNISPTTTPPSLTLNVGSGTYITTLASNYSFKNDIIDIIGIQLINTANTVTYKFINRDNPTVRTFSSVINVYNTSCNLNNVFIGGMPDSSNNYANYGIEMNIYELFINGDILTDAEMLNKYNTLYNKWIV
jgi:hypothetical protein